MRLKKFAVGKSARRVGTMGVVLAAAAMTVPQAGATEATHTAAAVQYKSGAFAEYSQVGIVKLGPYGQTRWPEGPHTSAVVNEQHPLVQVGAARTHSTGDAATGLAKANSIIGKLGVVLVNPSNLLPGAPSLLAVTASGVNAQCSAVDGRLTGSSSLGAVSVSLAGQSFAVPLRPEPNTKVGVPGVGYLTFNQQRYDKSGALEVTAISLKADPVLEKLLGGPVRSNFSTVKCGKQVDFSDPLGVNTPAKSKKA